MNGATSALRGPQLRRAAVDPFLAHIEAGGSGAAPGGNPGTRIAVDNRIIDLNHWEGAVLARGLKQRGQDHHAEAEIDGWPQRLAEGVAFQARYLTHVSRLQDGPPPSPAELDAFREELITDVALGLALQEELQRDVDNLVALGELDPAKKLTAFRHKIGQSLARLKELIGEDGFGRAEATAAEIAAPAPKQPRLAPACDLEEQAEVPTQFRRDLSPGSVQHIEVRAPSRVRTLALVLAASVVVAAGFHLALRRDSGPPPLPAATFRGLDGVREVKVRPPSLFVIVEPSRWTEMTAEEREALVDQVGQIAQRSGYSGVHVRTPAGAAVGQWLERGGVRLLAEHPPDGGKS